VGFWSSLETNECHEFWHRFAEGVAWGLLDRIEVWRVGSCSDEAELMFVRVDYGSQQRNLRLEN
jgi:hypothetical protein